MGPLALDEAWGGAPAAVPAAVPVAVPAVPSRPSRPSRRRAPSPPRAVREHTKRRRALTPMGGVMLSPGYTVASPMTESAVLIALGVIVILQLYTISLIASYRRESWFHPTRGGP